MNHWDFLQYIVLDSHKAFKDCDLPVKSHNENNLSLRLIHNETLLFRHFEIILIPGMGN